MKRIVNSLKNNIGLKLLSVLVAIVIWYVVVDLNDPVEGNSYPVKVTVENEAYIANGKQIYHIDDSYKTVTVFLRANRSTLRRITAEDIVVTADLTQIVDLNRDPVMVPLTATCAGVPQTGISLARTTIPISIESIATKTFPVLVDTGDSDPSQEYEVAETTPNPDQLVISGPESIINQIDSVLAEIDVTGMTQSSSRKATLTLMNKSLQKMSQDTLEDDLTFEGGMPNITVRVELWKRLTDIVLEPTVGGTPAEGYHVESTQVTPETIAIVGDEPALQRMEAGGNVLKIPKDLLSVEGAKETVVKEIELSEILPSNTRLARNMAETATVTMQILSDEVTEIELDVDNIAVENLAGTLAVSYGQASIPVRVRGSGAVIGKLTDKDLNASIDLKDLTPGEQTVPIRMTLPSGISLVQEVQITVTIKEKTATEAEPSATPTPTATATPSPTNG